jgi:iron complex transport system substrate-binding protein
MKTFRSIFILAVLTAVFLAAMSAACSTSRVGNENVTYREVTDDLGRAVKVPVHIERAVSLAPSLTEMVFAVGAGERLIGVTTYCNYPAAALNIAKVGDTQNPNIETIIALRPQIVFVSTASQLQAFTSTLEQQHIAVYVTDPHDLDGVFRDMLQLAELFGTAAQTTNAVAALRYRVEAVKARTAGKPRPRVFFQLSRDPLYTIGRDSYLAGVIDAAGGDLLTRDIATAYPTLSKETALAMDPQVILLSDSEDNRQPNDVFVRSEAVKSGRVVRINADIAGRPGPRLVDALEAIAIGLHGASVNEKEK